MHQSSYKTCPDCSADIVLKISFNQLPYFLPLVIHSVNINMTQYITIQDQKYRLCGLIYFGDFHYTCQIVDRDGRIWYNDGQDNQTSYQGHIVSHEYSRLTKCKGRELAVILYCID